MSRLLTLPFELRHQILTEAIQLEMANGFQYTTYQDAVSFDRPLICVLSATATWRHEATAIEFGTPSFYGKKPMTRLMRVNRQLHKEAFDIIWSEMVIFPGPWPCPLPLCDWLPWLNQCNPRAKNAIRHVQIHLQHNVAVTDTDSWSTIVEAYSEVDMAILEDITPFDSLICIRLQLTLHFKPRRKDPQPLNKPISQDQEDYAVKRLTNLANMCKARGLNVMLFLTHYPGPEAETIIRRCQRQIGQRTTMPQLYAQCVKIRGQCEFKISDAARTAQEEGRHLIDTYYWQR